MNRNLGRSGRPYRRFRLLVLKTYGNVCYLCGRAIDLDLPARHPESWTVEHLDPVSLGGAVLDLDRARPAHYRCNSARGNRPITTAMRTSTDW